MMKTLRTVWLSAGVRCEASPDAAAGSMFQVLAMLRSVPPIIGKFGAKPVVSLMSTAHLLRLATGSTERPMILTLRLSNSGLRRAMGPRSVVQTGGNAFGWEDGPAHK